MRDAAEALILDGWGVVAVNPGEKRASTSWQKRTYAAGDFKANDNLAVKCGELSGWRVDVDCDAQEAIAAARDLLPRTELVHGRASKPDSHYWFHCEGIKTSQFTDVKDSSGKTAMLIEIRSTGGYTLVPPSTHPSKEVLAWSVQRGPMSIAPDALYEAVRNVAIAALVARHWPGSGARHAATGHLAGFLVQAGLDEAAIVRIILTAARIAGDTDLRDREAFARSTCDKYKNDPSARLTGGPRLAESLGEAVVAKLRAWLRMADMDALEAMNAKHFFVRLGVKAVIGREECGEVVFQPVRELYPEYANVKVQTGQDKDGDPEFKSVFPTWLEWPQRRTYSRVVMAALPRVAPVGAYNLWKGFALEPKASDCHAFLDHLRDVICSGNVEHYEYLLKWLAFAVQQPGTTPGVALVMRGKQGTGKGTVVRMLERIFGKRHCAHLDRSKDLVDFNAMISGKVLVFADEAFFAGDKQHIGALKRIITEPTTRVTRKHIDSDEEDNNLHLIMATNEDWAIPAGIGERRFFVVDVSEAHQDERAYFDAIYQEMENGGDAAFLHHLTHIHVTHVRDFPRTAALRDQQEQSLDFHLQWWNECLHLGIIGGLPWEQYIPAPRMYDAYKLWARERTPRFLNSI